jgi:hypothetical protein
VGANEPIKTPTNNSTANSFPAAATAVVVCVLIAVAVVSLRKGGLSYRDEPRTQHINCVNNLKQVALAFRQWALDNGDRYPFNVPTSAGVTLEFCAVGLDGFDRNAALHFQVMSNELNTPMILICPKDRSKKRAADFSSLKSSNVTYRLRSGTKLAATNATEILAVCPIDGNTLYCDGGVKEGNANAR